MTRPQYYDQDSLSPSEDFYYSAGSYLFCDPQVVESWSRSVLEDQTSLPTPPESILGCSPLEYPDMSALPWSQDALPEDWTSVSMEPNCALPSSASDGWSSSCAPASSQCPQLLDSFSWGPTQGNVVTGSSPVLSHESQSSATLTSVSEPSSIGLTKGPDSHYADPEWNHVHCYGSDASLPVHVHSFGTAYGSTEVSKGRYPALASMPRSTSSMNPKQVPRSRQEMSHSTVMRPLVPRFERTLSTGSQAAHGHSVASQPYTQGYSMSRAPSSSVSSAAGQPGVTSPQSGNTYYPALDYAGYVSGPAAQHLGMNPMMMASFPTQPAYGRSSPSMASTSSIGQDNYPAYYHGSTGHMTGQTLPPDGATSHEMPYMTYHGLPASVPEETEGDLDLDNESPSHGPDNGITKEMINARRKTLRTHPLYFVEHRDADGNLHCPYANGPSACQHQPVRLKCNYDKYIDSHLRPFTCKLGQCAGQQFSSVACLLRHEREAHGMHGHGDKPFYCKFTGCDRSVEGSGFPRAYNLRDHMKRVHDYVDPAVKRKSARNPAQSKAKKPTGVVKKKSTAPSSTRTAALSQAAAPSPLRASVSSFGQSAGPLQQDPSNADISQAYYHAPYMHWPNHNG